MKIGKFWKRRVMEGALVPPDNKAYSEAMGMIFVGQQ